MTVFFTHRNKDSRMQSRLSFHAQWRNILISQPIKFCVLALAAAAATGCQQAGPMDTSATEGQQAVGDLYIVDCLLPGQVRRLGNASYLSARRPIRTTAGDCRIRGGEYVEYDRADYRSALRVWLPRAEEGDAEAQNYVGEIFEKGLGQTPDYASAASWYRKSAEQGYSRAQINLGYLYEKGQGVPRDMAAALNWYRKASGLTDDALVLSSEAQEQMDALRQQLAAQLKKAQVQTDYLKQQLAELQEQAEAAPPGRTPSSHESDMEDQLEALTALYEGAMAERDSLDAQLNALATAYRQADDSFLKPAALAQGREQVMEDISFGRYFALIIGNQDYVFLDDLRSPLRDAERLQQVLETKYGFSTLLISNASEKNLLHTINRFYEQIGENDNLLIYYAGHGNLSRSEQSRTERGYWLPVDAQKDNITNWINNAVISDHLDRLKARSVLVISDSCYAGQLGSEKSPFLFGISSAAETEQTLRAGLSRRARVVISSGGLRPVLDGTDQTHSVFAKALLDALTANDKPLRDSGLFSQLSVNVRKRSAINEQLQVPEMKPVREAGHEGGTFYFVPVGSGTSDS